jgi:hypothetical protein
VGSVHFVRSHVNRTDPAAVCNRVQICVIRALDGPVAAGRAPARQLAYWRSVVPVLSRLREVSSAWAEILAERL